MRLLLILSCLFLTGCGYWKSSVDTNFSGKYLDFEKHGLIAHKMEKSKFNFAGVNSKFDSWFAFKRVNNSPQYFCFENVSFGKGVYIPRTCKQEFLLNNGLASGRWEVNRVIKVSPYGLAKVMNESNLYYIGFIKYNKDGTYETAYVDKFILDNLYEHSDLKVIEPQDMFYYFPTIKLD